MQKGLASGAELAHGLDAASRIRQTGNIFFNRIDLFLCSEAGRPPIASSCAFCTEDVRFHAEEK